MKKLVSMAVIASFLFSVDANAMPNPKGKKKETKTEKSCSEGEKKACASGEKKSCCAAKKAEGTK